MFGADKLFLIVAGALTIIVIIVLFVVKCKSRIRELNKAFENQEVINIFGS